MVHVGVKLFFPFIYNPMKRPADETGRSKELEILIKFFKQLQAAARVRIPHPGIRISKSDLAEADCHTTNTISPQPLLGRGCKPVLRVHYEEG